MVNFGGVAFLEKYAGSMSFECLQIFVALKNSIKLLHYLLLPYVPKDKSLMDSNWAI